MCQEVERVNSNSFKIKKLNVTKPRRATKAKRQEGSPNGRKIKSLELAVNETETQNEPREKFLGINATE